MHLCNSTRKTAILLSCLLIISVFALPAFAADSVLINYQGMLTNTDSEPVTGTPSMTFRIYGIDGPVLWYENHSAVTVTGGLFSVVLGSQTALPDTVFNGDDRYLGITVGVDDEIEPRILFTAAPGAVLTRRVNGDIKTAPGVVQIVPPDPCVPPEPCTPVRLEVYSPEACDPTENCSPIIELIANTDTSSIRITPPDPCVPPDPCTPAFEVVSNSENMTSSINLRPPPDDNKPSIAMKIDAVENTGWMSLTNYDASGSAPGVVMSTGAENGNLTVGYFMPPPDDSKPPPDDNKPMITMSVDATAAQMGIGTDSPVEALTVMGNGWFSGDMYILTDTKVKSNIVPIDGALEKVGQMNGYYYDCRTEEYPGLNLPATRQVGFLASEVKEVVPEAVGENEYGLTGVSYSRITALLVEAVKELKTENEELKARIETLENR